MGEFDWWKPGQDIKSADLSSVVLKERTDDKGETFSTYVATDKYARSCQLRRVTTIIGGGAGSKWGLPQWYAIRSAAEARNILKRFVGPAGSGPEFRETDLESACTAIRNAAEVAMSLAATRGSRAHYMMEWWLQHGMNVSQAGILEPLKQALAGAILPPTAKYRTLRPDRLEWALAHRAVVRFITWWAEFQKGLTARLRFVASETVVADMEFGYAGTCDLIVVLEDGTAYFIDWKTSPACYPEYDLQLMAYAMAASKKYPQTLAEAIDPNKVHGYVVRSHVPMPWEEVCAGLTFQQEIEQLKADFEAWPAFKTPETRELLQTNFGAAMCLYEWKQAREFANLPKVEEETPVATA